MLKRIFYSLLISLFGVGYAYFRSLEDAGFYEFLFKKGFVYYVLFAFFFIPFAIMTWKESLKKGIDRFNQWASDGKAWKMIVGMLGTLMVTAILVFIFIVFPIVVFLRN